MITDVKKYLILGTQEDLDLFYQRAQQEGFIEFISASRRPKELPEEIQTLIKAMKFLQKLPSYKDYEGEWDPEEIEQLAKHVLRLKAKLEKLQEEERIVEAEIARITPLGDFSLEDIRFIEQEGHCKIQFFCTKAGKVEETCQEEGVFPVGSFFDLEYFMSISAKARTLPGMIEMRIDCSLCELHEQKMFVIESKGNIEEELKQYAGYLDYFHEVLIEKLNAYHLESAKDEVSYPLPDANLFMVESWIPATKVSKMFSLLSGLSVHCEQIQIEETDSIPTVMENTGMRRLGEDLVRIYDIPSTKDKDPSGWVFWFFALFFAMIIADAGYGLLYLTLAVFLKWKFPTLKGSAKRLFRLGVTLSFCIVAWGVLTCSYFGLSIAPDSFLGKISPMQHLVALKAEYHLKMHDLVYQEWVAALPQLAQAKTGKEFVALGVKHTPLGVSHVVFESFVDNILLEFSLMLGIIHIILSLLRYSGRSFSNWGWVMFLLGGYLFFPFMLHVTSMAHFLGWIQPALAGAMGKQLIYVGIGFALALAFVQKKWRGILELTRIIELFGDILSYLRLYALALAGTILAETFNNMGEVVGLVGGFFVIILGHGINISLGLMSGSIHGLRLNFIEWYHYSFYGGGRLFKPLMLLKSKED